MIQLHRYDLLLELYRKTRQFVNHGKEGYSGHYRCKMTMGVGPHSKKIQTANYWNCYPSKKQNLFNRPPCGCNGRTLEFLGTYTNLSNQHSSIEEAVDWLIKHQEKNGSWYGRWGICYIYGTWAAITGLCSVRVFLPSNQSR